MAKDIEKEISDAKLRVRLYEEREFYEITEQQIIPGEYVMKNVTTSKEVEEEDFEILYHEPEKGKKEKRVKVGYKSDRGTFDDPAFIRNYRKLKASVEIDISNMKKYDEDMTKYLQSLNRRNELKKLLDSAVDKNLLNSVYEQYITIVMETKDYFLQSACEMPRRIYRAYNALLQILQVDDFMNKIMERIFKKGELEIFMMNNLENLNQNERKMLVIM
jgi:hypothetical protein